jgi:DNA-binding Lrp family transcriptional regulator
VPAKIDATDLRIIKELTADGRMSNVGLAQRVGISAPPCLRRVRALENSGVIQGYHAQVDLDSLGFTVVAFVSVALHNQSEKDLRAFEELILTWPEVREAYMMSGETDYHLKCVAKSLTEFQDFHVNTVSSAPNVASVKVQVAMRPAKFAAGVPL